MTYSLDQATQVEQLDQNLAWFEHPIPADFWAELKDKRLLREDAPVPG